MGDINDDSEVNETDLQYIVNYIINLSNAFSFHVSVPHKTVAKDITIVLRHHKTWLFHPDNREQTC